MSDEHTGQEQDTGSQCVQIGADAGFNAGNGLDESGNGGSTGAGTCDGTNSISNQYFLHVGHIAVFIQHTDQNSNFNSISVKNQNVEQTDEHGNTDRNIAM